MHYKFPTIKHIDDVLPAIKDDKNFIVAKKDGYQVINYLMTSSETFPEVTDTNSALRRECRGLIFDSEGNLISRRLHKFFNVGEKEETFPENIDWKKEHVILEKLDGSMVTPIPLKTETGVRFRLGTKMGITDVAMNAEYHCVFHPSNYYRFFHDCYIRGFTPIFEWCSNKNRIVVNHPKDQLVLIAVRVNLTGAYFDHDFLVAKGEEHGIPVVQTFFGNANSMQELLDHTKALEGEEGYVIRFNDGHMCKVKGDWYVNLHRTKEFLSRERYLVDVIINDRVDDLKSFMLPEDLKRVEEYEKEFNFAFLNFHDYVREIADNALKFDRKTFSLGQPNLNPAIRALVFRAFDGCNLLDEIKNNIKKKVGNNRAFDEMKALWFSDLKWDEYAE